MATHQPPISAEAEAHRSADALALALEEIGYDVGRAFPALNGTVNRDGAPVVELGTVSASTAESLARVLVDATRHGVTA